MLKKILSRINIIDILIIISAFVIIVSLFCRLVSEKFNTGTGEYTVTASCISCPDSVIAIINTKPQCFLYETQKPFGKITSVKQMENTTDLSLRFSTSARQAEHGITISGSQLLIGQHLSLVADNAVFTVFIEDIVPSREEAP